MKVELINGKLYQEVDRKDIQSKLDQLEQQKTSIDYNALKVEYESNVAQLKGYEKSIDAEIRMLKDILK